MQRRHVLLGALISIAYIALVAMRENARLGPLALGLGLGAALGLGWLASRAKARPLAWACWSAGVTVAAASSDAPSLTLHAASLIGAFIASAAAVIALARTSTLGGIVRDRPRSPRIAIVLLVVVWLPTCITLLNDRLLTSAAALSGLLVTCVAVAARLERRLELGVIERLQAFLLLSLSLGVVGVLIAAAGPLDTPATACAATAIVGLAACATASLEDPDTLWHGVRRYVTLAAIAVVVGSAFIFLVGEQRDHERGLVAMLAFAGIAIGAELPRLARAVRPPNRRLLAIAAASRALRGRDADLAVASALRALQEASGPPKEAARTPSPELWTLDPSRVSRVDTAGYLHETSGELPPELLIVACNEPAATLRAEALAAVEIRRPDLRGLSRWMSDAKMASATLVARGGDIEGVLLVPASEGGDDLTLEEARALRELADELAPICHARAQLARSMQRERASREEADDATTKAERFEHQLARASAQHALATGRLARPAAVGIYAARSRLAYEALEKLARAHAPVSVVAPSGVDPVPFLARAHLAGARGHAPLVLVDGTSSRDHDAERWRDPVASPLALADGGLLVLLDAAALPLDVQHLVGQSLAERRAPWARADSLDIVLAMTTTTGPRSLADAGRLDPLLASRLGAAIDDPVHLPRIAERAEDIRALVTDRLAREGLRVRGTPVGIDDAAFALLVDHPFEGEDAELAAIVQRLVARTSSEVIHEADVEAVLTAQPADGSPGFGGGPQTLRGVVSRRP